MHRERRVKLFIKKCSELSELRVSVVESLFFFGCGSAALGLCGEYSFTVNPEEPFRSATDEGGVVCP